MKALLILYCLVLSLAAKGQAWKVVDLEPRVSWFWGSYDEGLKFLLDNDGNIYKVKIGWVTVNSSNGNYLSNRDSIFKLSPSGSIIWKIPVENTNSDYTKSLTSIHNLRWGSNGDILLFISKNDSIRCGDFSFKTSRKGFTYFVLTLEKSLGKTTSLMPLFNGEINVLANGGIQGDFYEDKDRMSFSATMQGSIYFFNTNDSLRIDPVIGSPGEGRPLFICFSPSGNKTWHKLYGNQFEGQTAMPQYFSGSIIFTNNRFLLLLYAGNENAPQTQPGPRRFFFSTVDTAGNEVSRANFIDPMELARISEVINDKDGNIYMTGVYHQTLNYRSLNHTNKSSWNYFLLKLDKNLNVSWFKYSVGVNQGSFGLNLTLSTDNNVHVFGCFGGTQTIEGQKKYTPVNKSRYFIASYHTDGSLKQINFPEGTYVGGVGQIAADQCNSLYISGLAYADSTQFTYLDFGKGATIYTGAGSHNFLVRYKTQTTGFGPKQGCAGDIIEVTGRDQHTYKWTLDDSLQFFTEKFKIPQVKAGLHNLEVSLFNAKGCQAFGSGSIMVMAPPRAAFGTENIRSCQYTKALFNDSSAADTIHPLVGRSWHWYWGDGTDTLIRGNNGNLSHIYKSSGRFTVSLVFSNGFCSDSTSRINTIEIIPAPGPGFKVNSNFGCIPFLLQIEDTTSTAIFKSHLITNLATGNHVAVNGSGHNYNATLLVPGRYMIVQSFTGATGCVTIDTGYVKVIRGFNVSDTLKIINVTYVDDSTEIELSWHSDERAVAYNIYLNGKKAGVSRDTSFSIKTTVAPHEFMVTASDSCGHFTVPSKTFSNIFLSVRNHHNEYFLLTYTAFRQWENGVKEYQVESYLHGTWNTEEKSNTVAPWRNDISIQDDASNILYRAYRVKAFEMGGNEQVSRSNAVYATLNPLIFVPNAFTPNGDGLNDHFKPTALGISSWTLKIYSRWGEKIFEGDMTSPGWDGMFNGQACAEGVFMYTVDWAGNTLQDKIPRESISGTVQLLRFP
jgi:gliding motility-associated-like protein